MQMRITSKEQEELVLSNIKLVHYIVRKLNLNNNMYEDNVSVGTIGLVKAAITYEPSKEIKFATYAEKCITNEIFMFLRRSRKKQANEVSMSTETVEEGNLTLEDTIPSHEEAVEDQIIRNESTERIISIMLNELKPKETMCIFYKMVGKKQQEIAEILHFAQSYISRMEKSVMSKIATYMEMKILPEGEFRVENADNGEYKISSSNKETIRTITEALKSIKKRPYCKVICSADLLTIRIMPYEECFEFMAEIVGKLYNKPEQTHRHCNGVKRKERYSQQEEKCAE